MKLKFVLISKNLLILNLMVPIFGILLLAFVPVYKTKLLKIIALNSACLSFSCSLFL
jgi:hypothetical protein